VYSPLLLLLSTAVGSLSSQNFDVAMKFDKPRFSVVVVGHIRLLVAAVCPDTPSGEFLQITAANSRPYRFSASSSVAAFSRSDRVRTAVISACYLRVIDLIGTDANWIIRRRTDETRRQTASSCSSSVRVMQILSLMDADTLAYLHSQCPSIAVGLASCS